MNWSRWLPADVSTYGHKVDSLFGLIFWLTSVVFLLVAATMLVFLWKYRDRGDGRRALYTHGNDTLEVIWTVIPTVVFLGLAVISARSWAEVKINIPQADLVVRAEGKQFNWLFTYPGPDGVLDTADDYANQENFLRVPVHKKVRIELASADVIHSFFLPHFRVKQDAVPGRTIPMWFEATRPGTYEIACAELCGSGHTRMGGKLFVLDAASPADWSRMDAQAVTRGWPRSLQPPAAAAP